MSVTFADGTTVTPDLVIGADGIHSAVRRHYVVSSNLLPHLLCNTAFVHIALSPWLDDLLPDATNHEFSTLTVM